jgi:hypothetical protein
MKNTIPWKSTIDINTTRNLFSLNNEILPYEIELYICSCTAQKRIIKKAKQELEKYQCSECGNEVFYDAAYYLSNHAWYEIIENMPFYNLLEDNLKIEIKYGEDQKELLFLFTLQIPNSIEPSSEKVGYLDKTIYSFFVKKNGGYGSKLMVDVDMDFLRDKYIISENLYEYELINKHPLVVFFNNKILKLLIKHPFCNDLGLVKYDCTSMEDISFFLQYPHLKEYNFLAWQELFLLPNDKPRTIKQALDYILNYRKEKSLQKVVFQNYTWQISTTKKYYFAYVRCVCKYISDVNIATRMVTFTFNGLNMELRHDSGEEKLFTYLVQNYTQKQIERLMHDFSKDYADMYFVILHMFSQFEDDTRDRKS